MYEKYFVFIKAILISLMCFRFLRGSGYLFASFPKNRYLCQQYSALIPTNSQPPPAVYPTSPRFYIIQPYFIFFKPGFDTNQGQVYFYHLPVAKKVGRCYVCWEVGPNNFVGRSRTHSQVGLFFGGCGGLLKTSPSDKNRQFFFISSHQFLPMPFDKNDIYAIYNMQKPI